MRKMILLLAFVGIPCQSQVLTLPQEMGLPDSRYVRPDPANYQLALDNGLIAYIAEADQVPLVTLSAFVHAGKVSDDQQGAAEALQSALQNDGPGDMTVTAFSAALRRMTAEFSVNMHDEWTEISLNVPVEDLDQALAIFSGLLRNPAIGEASIERAAKGATPAAADLGGESGPALYAGSMNEAVARFYEVLYKDHPYGRNPTAQEFNDLSTADVASFHARYFVPGNMSIAVAGAIDPDAMHERIAGLFGDWPAAAVPAPKQMPPVSRIASKLHHFTANKLQSWLVIGHDLPPVPLEDQAAFEVMDYILGEYHMNTRLMRETRYKFGYTNDASSFREPRWHGPGSYTFRSYSRPEVIRNIYDNMMRELHRMREEEVSDREMFVAQGALSDGAFQVRYLDGYALTRSFALERLRYGNHDHSASYVERVRAVTKKDVLAAARKYIRPENLQVILVGDKAFSL